MKNTFYKTGCIKIVKGSEAFNFLNKEEVLYSKKDIKEKY
jgi:hypothetical protein